MLISCSTFLLEFLWTFRNHFFHQCFGILSLCVYWPPLCYSWYSLYAPECLTVPLPSASTWCSGGWWAARTWSWPWRSCLSTTDTGPSTLWPSRAVESSSAAPKEKVRPEAGTLREAINFVGRGFTLEVRGLNPEVVGLIPEERGSNPEGRGLNLEGRSLNLEDRFNPWG